MKNNIFLKSVLRQPIRTLILSILIGAAAFAFVARTTEYVVVRDELTRIEAFYRSVGILSPLRFNDFTTDHDVTRALEVVEGNRHVAISDTRNFTQGVLADMFNIAVQPVITGGSVARHYFNPILHGVDIRMADHFFIGSLRRAPRLVPGSDPPELNVIVNIEELILGDPTALRVGDRVFYNERGQTITLAGWQAMRLFITETERDLFQQGLWHPFDGLQLGEPALFRATPTYEPNIYRQAFWFGFTWYLRPLIGKDGLQYVFRERDDGSVWYRPMAGVGERCDSSDMVFYVDGADETAIAEMLYILQDEFALITENLSSVTVVGTKDMTAMPRFMDGQITRLLDTPLSPAGRLLTYEDYLSSNPVAVIPASFAIRRNISIGDSITITLRDNPRPVWIDTPTTSPWARGIENWWDNNAQGWWGLIDAAHDDWRSFPTYELELEVVGIYWFFPPHIHNFSYVEIFIPAGLIPDGFGWDDVPGCMSEQQKFFSFATCPLLTGMYSFVLDSPRSEEAFLRDTRSALYALGFSAVFMPNDFENLAAATDPIRLSITVNLIVFGAASALIFAFVVLLYLRQWRKSVAIAQALGIPGDKVLGQLFAPVVVFWVPSMIIGGVIAWFFALAQAETALATLAAYDAAVLPQVQLLFILCGLLIVFILVGVWFGGYGVVRRPVLTQLQGGAQKQSKASYIDPGVVPTDFVVGDFELPKMPATAGFGTVLCAALRYNIRYIFRTLIKTVLALLLALIFVFSLGWLNNTIHSTEAEVTRLWDTTIINAEIFINFEDRNRTDINWPAAITPNAWDAIVFSGFYRDSYLESFASIDASIFLGVSHLEGLIAKNTKTPVDEQLGVTCTDMEIEFMPGFGPEDFVYVIGQPIPMIIRREIDEPSLHFANSHGQVIGVFDGGLQWAINRFGESALIYVIPFEIHQAIFAGSWPFYGGFNSLNTYHPPLLTARFTIDPARNRDIDQLWDMVRPALNNNNFGFRGFVPLILHINDDMIHNVIIPMEQNLSFLRVLYPIAIGVAFLLALGLSLLTMLQNAKNAAIMRVLGKPRLASQIMLCVEQLMVCAFGIVLGLLILFIAVAGVSTTPLLLAGVYFGGAIIGSAIGSFVISMRAPLDLLQVRE